MITSEKLRLLQADTKKVQFFLDQFSASRNGKRSVQIVEDGELVILKNFPLPNKYLPHDEIDLVLVTSNYPQKPPQGMHVLQSRENGKLLSQLQEKFGHTYDRAAVSEAEEIEGYSWLCVHYKNFKWEFDLDWGDNLYKLLTVFSNLLEGEKS